MASYKVPQDVEADDKLLGPFSFRQFIYLMIVAAAIAVAYFLYRMLPPLAIIPVPVILFFGILALPLRKDQPMEIYMAAILSYYLKPRQRLWDPDGMETLVQIAAPRTTEPQRTKNISGDEAEQRLRYLSSLADSRGWSVRGVAGPQGTSMNEDVFHEAQQIPDVLDDSGAVAQNLDHMISQANQRRHQEMLSRFQTAAAIPAPQQPMAAPAPPPIPDPYEAFSPISVPETPPPAPQQPAVAPPAPAATPIAPTQPEPMPSTPTPQYNPYPVSMNQAVIQPLSQQAPAAAPPPPVPPTPAPETSTKAVSPDIINLASNTDLSIETIAREAHRITEKEAALDSEEVIISLR